MNVNVTQTARPIRLAFLIKPGSKKSYQDCLHICTSMWGGKHFPIIPFYQKFSKQFIWKYCLIGEKPKEFYNSLFENFQVDFIVYDDSLDQGILTKFFESEKLVNINLIKSSLTERVKYGIGLHDILPSYLKEKFEFVRTDGMTAKFPLIDQNDLYLQTILGSVTDEYLIRLREVSTTAINYELAERDQLDSFLQSNVQCFFDVGNFKLDGNQNWWAHGTIFLGNPDQLDDLIQFWNLRAIGRDVMMLPIDNFKSTVYINEIRRIISNYLEIDSNVYGISVIGNNLPEDFDDEELDSYLKLFMEKSSNDNEHFFSYQHWLPRFWAQGFILSYDRASAKAVYTQSTSHVIENKDIMSIPVIHQFSILRNVNDNLLPAFCNELSMTFSDGSGKYAEVVPEMSSKEAEKFLKRVGRETAKIRRNRLMFFAHPYSYNIEFSLPKNLEVFELIFKRNSSEIRISTAGKLTELVLNNIGGIGGINFLMNKGVLPILDMFEKHHIVEHRELFASIMKHKKDIRWFREPKAIVQKFIDYKIIQLGLKICCPFCDRSSFYKIEKGLTILKCGVCQNDFNLPLNNPNELKWAYQVSGPFNMNNKANGILSVLLTLRFFKTPLQSEGGSFLLSYEVLKDKICINEVDLTILIQSYRSNEGKPDLLFCECKTGSDFEKKDVDKMKLLGKIFPGCILTFATLKTGLNKKESKLIKSLASHYRKGTKKRPICPILILTRNELVPENPFDPFHNFKENNKIHYSDPDEMGNLCDLTVERYLGLKPYRKIYEEYWMKKADNNKQK